MRQDAQHAIRTRTSSLAASYMYILLYIYHVYYSVQAPSYYTICILAHYTMYTTHTNIHTTRILVLHLYE